MDDITILVCDDDREIVEAIEARNPMVITSHHFTYEGKTYDAVRDADEVVALHKRLRAEG